MKFYMRFFTISFLYVSVIAVCFSSNTALAKGNFDAAPFAVSEIRNSEQTTYGLYWSEPKKISELIVEFDPNTNVPDPNTFKVQFWHNTWNGLSDVKKAAGVTGWDQNDDWTKGRWVDAEVILNANSNRWAITFKTLDRLIKEFKIYHDLDLDKNNGVPVNYIKTLKVRLKSSEPFAKPVQFKVLTESVYHDVSLTIRWEKPERKGVEYSTGVYKGTIRAQNGLITGIRTLTGEDIKLNAGEQWLINSAEMQGIQADLRYALDPDDQSYDNTVVSVSLGELQFSFRASDIAKGERIYIKDLGVLITKKGDNTTIDQYKTQIENGSSRTVYDRVFDHPEQTLENAWKDMPIKEPLNFVHGLPHNRNVFKQMPNGEFRVGGEKANWKCTYQLPVSERDTKRKLWSGYYLNFNLNLPPKEYRTGRKLIDGYIPVLTTTWQALAIHYEQTAFLYPLDGDLNEIDLDDPTVILCKIRITNTDTAQNKNAELYLHIDHDEFEGFLEENKGDVYGSWSGGKNFRLHLKHNSDSTWKTSEGGLRWIERLSPGDPAFAQDAVRGETIFAAVGCTSCHIPILMTGPDTNPVFDRRPVALYSDLLLHDVATGDGIPQAAALANEIRTPALWGLRFRRPFLHDGSAATPLEAILRHGNEAQTATTNYRELPTPDQAALLAFLDSL
ncbi:MAG: hypothetical protein IIA45_10145 [Bacteroidetes bacterium]|nr:hypothetical protein [Bacteroidota bacterium]